ncbi:hypothetical protein Dtox_1976 [Desulfofarcimen acetoxidans DSM 771]|uniref:Uncharacterized protein n=1 Tax=Desulfofarcimen acetoxidans (strain ATCC 49208 / DSM 771 / KCTC 5769 / VKM B-1644 / 5575) TaxID=485916 RepID=C8VYD1_DESAS|nr:hypothetical protein [Desulfofarcimen acetoxidans]ACV62812.1 hypothetical protein Dtox_1976 [Desulfofarcimen acetoxidans DSM 771]
MASHPFPHLYPLDRIITGYEIGGILDQPIAKGGALYFHLIGATADIETDIAGKIGGAAGHKSPAFIIGFDRHTLILN